jgi:hypothetical protein
MPRGMFLWPGFDWHLDLLDSSHEGLLLLLWVLPGPWQPWKLARQEAGRGPAEAITGCDCF